MTSKLAESLETFRLALASCLPTDSADERLVDRLVARATQGSTTKLSAGKAQKAILEYLDNRDVKYELPVTEMVKHPSFRGISFQDITRAAKALAKAGKVKYDGLNIRLVVDKYPGVK